MLRGLLFSVAVILLVPICRSTVKAPQLIDEAAISDEIQESKTRKPYFVQTAVASSFREKYRGRFGIDPVFVTEKGEASVYLINMSEAKDAALADFQLREAGKYPPFIYFDPTYNMRLQQGYTSPEDLMAGYKDPMLNEVLLAGVVQAFSRHAKLHIIGRQGWGAIFSRCKSRISNPHRKKSPCFSPGLCTAMSSRRRSTVTISSMKYSKIREVTATRWST